MLTVGTSRDPFRTSPCLACRPVATALTVFFALIAGGAGSTQAQEKADTLGCRRDEVVIAKTAETSEGANDEETAKPKPVQVLICTIPDRSGDPARLRIRTLKLNELAISALIHDWPLTFIRDSIGTSADVIETEVLSQAKSLNARFAQTDAELGNPATTLLILNESGGYDRSIETDTETEPFRLLMSDGAINGGIENIRYEIALPQEFEQIASTDVWPTGWSFYYGDTPLALGVRPRSPPAGSPSLWFKKRSAIEKTRIWRYLTKADFDHYKENFFVTGRSAQQAYTVSVFDRSGYIEQSGGTRWPLYLDAIREFTVGEFPDDFLFAYGSFYQSKGSVNWEFLFPPRRVNLEVDVVENISGKGIDILQIGFNKSRDQNLRKAADTELSRLITHAKSGDEPWHLAPGGRLIIPKRILLEYDRATTQAFSDQAAAANIYQRIRALPVDGRLELHNTTDWLDLLSQSPVVAKRTDSFAAPQRPSFDPYVDGPALRIAYLETATGKLRVRDGAAPQVVGFTAHAEGGQCPILEVYDDATRTYKPFGKVLVSSDWDYAARDQVIPFDGPQLHFRLVERELEVSLIDQAKLTAILKTGERIDLEADVRHLVHRDGRHVVLFSGETIDFTFPLPSGVSLDRIQATTLTLRGHYQRYGNLLLTKSEEDGAFSRIPRRQQP